MKFLHYREVLLRLRSENAELRGLLKEQKSTECKEKESTDASGNSSDGQAELRKSVETLQVESKAHSQVSNLSEEVLDGETHVSAEGTESPDSQSNSAMQHVSRHGVSFALWEKCRETLLSASHPVFSISVPFVLIVGGCQISPPGPCEAQSGVQQRQALSFGCCLWF